MLNEEGCSIPFVFLSSSQVWRWTEATKCLFIMKSLTKVVYYLLHSPLSFMSWYDALELTKYNGTASLSNSSLLTTPTQHFEFPASPVSMFDITSRVEFSAEIITHCVALFFHWSHQYCSIVDREQFLVTYLELSSSKTYAHLALEYAICALGALSCPETRNLAESFSLASTQNFEMGGLYFPSHTSIQAFLLSSYYQIGKGDFSKAWMLAGIAFRMSEDLMYNDKNEEANQGTLRDIDIDSRRRMFMTCYESDKFPLWCPETEAGGLTWL